MKKQPLVYLFVFVLTVSSLQAQEKYYSPDWEYLARYEVPTWFQDAKFGIFIHWGVYSVPAYRNEWYPRNIYRKQSPEHKYHVQTYGPPDQLNDNAPSKVKLGQVEFKQAGTYPLTMRSDPRGEWHQRLSIRQITLTRIETR